MASWEHFLHFLWFSVIVFFSGLELWNQNTLKFWNFTIIVLCFSHVNLACPIGGLAPKLKATGTCNRQKRKTPFWHLLPKCWQQCFFWNANLSVCDEDWILEYFDLTTWANLQLPKSWKPANSTAHIYMYTHLHKYIHAHLHIYRHIHRHIHRHIRKHIRKHIHTYSYTHTHTLRDADWDKHLANSEENYHETLSHTHMHQQETYVLAYMQTDTPFDTQTPKAAWPGTGWRPWPLVWGFSGTRPHNMGQVCPVLCALVSKFRNQAT